LSIGKGTSRFGLTYDSGLQDIRFFTREMLLAITFNGDIELYSVKDLSEAPRLQARFVMPFISAPVFRYPSVFHSSSSCARPTAPDEHWIWATNPADRVISVITHLTIIVISARIFFMDIPPTWFDATSRDGQSVPWLSWGPQNSRCLPQEILGYGVGGSRVIWALLVSGSSSYDPLFQLHMTDFNPSAVARGIGKVVREPTILKTHDPIYMQDVTTYLPYVEVVNDRIFNVRVCSIILNEESMLLFTTEPGFESVSVFPLVERPGVTISSNRSRRLLRYLACSHLAGVRLFQRS
jgi:hypothetical protein